MISTKAPQPKPDPQLMAQTEQAQRAQQQAVQSSLSADTMQIIRLFGQQNAMSGAGMTLPMSSIASARPMGAR
jgi:hypothetical protein